MLIDACSNRICFVGFRMRGDWRVRSQTASGGLIRFLVYIPVLIQDARCSLVRVLFNYNVSTYVIVCKHKWSIYNWVKFALKVERIKSKKKHKIVIIIQKRAGLLRSRMGNWLLGRFTKTIRCAHTFRKHGIQRTLISGRVRQKRYKRSSEYHCIICAVWQATSPMRASRKSAAFTPPVLESQQCSAREIRTG